MSDSLQWVLWSFLRSINAEGPDDRADPDFDQLMAQMQDQPTVAVKSLGQWPDSALIAFRNVVQDFLSDIHEAEQAGSNAFSSNKLLGDTTPAKLSGPLLTEILARSGNTERVLPMKRWS
ncbi:hypothetical protein [Chachezhania sediminis]|uniref:hypothetical protein n=1 Tax=Chachezhania sediminis TaxID=2599291 RepID=UPI00131B527E|nr:hypothetical protein [Chachezhania sediminis]